MWQRERISITAYVACHPRPNTLVEAASATTAAMRISLPAALALVEPAVPARAVLALEMALRPVTNGTFPNLRTALSVAASSVFVSYVRMTLFRTAAVAFETRFFSGGVGTPSVFVALSLPFLSTAVRVLTPSDVALARTFAPPLV